MLKGKTAFITGTNRGLGKAFVEEFAKNGADVVAHSRKETPEFLSFCEEVAAMNGVSVRPVFFDMTDADKMKEVVKNLVSDKIPVHILVNNAGIAHSGLFQMTQIGKIREVFEVNLFSNMALTQQLLRYIVKCGGGSIVNVASVSGIDILVGNCAYGVSKAALIAFTKTLAAECGANGVRVNAIAPGAVDTDMANQMDGRARSGKAQRCAMNRRGLPLEIAKTAVFLSSDYASFVNGSVLRVDGGGVTYDV
jgi:3-oxoacyl-[acyl-carrier protein] reductase